MTYSLSFVTKRGVVLGLRVVLYLGGELVYDIFDRGSVYSIDGCREYFMFFFFPSFFYISLLYTGLITIFTYMYFIFIYMMMMYVFLHLPLHVLFLFSLYTNVSLCTQSLSLFHT